MLSEGRKVLLRRFLGKPVESGLLVFAVALGAGGTSLGLSLLGNVLNPGKSASVIGGEALPSKGVYGQAIDSLVLFLSIACLIIALARVSRIFAIRGSRIRKGVGILMALGASRRSVFRLFASEAIAVSFVGSLLGAIIALPLSRFLKTALRLSGFSPLLFLIGISASCLLALAFSIRAAWRNSRLDPTDAIRID